MSTNQRDYNTISPSAKSLLLMKGHTGIPFARQTAELITAPEKYDADFGKMDLVSQLRTAHFEQRYWSVDQLLTELSTRNVLELSSGFSFRGLAITSEKDIHYIDTDLPEIIASKKELMEALDHGNVQANGRLELLPLNALDGGQFRSIINRFSEGPVVIVNEGLLMYLDNGEKESLCAIIHDILKERGGYWITADIYVKGSPGRFKLDFDDKTRAFFERHNVEENKFQSFEEAMEFFRRMGFTIDKEADMDRFALTSVQYLKERATPEQLLMMKTAPKMRETWRLSVTGGKG
jgi:O-methyltransferase involved in polyketide biosynthesis